MRDESAHSPPKNQSGPTSVAMAKQISTNAKRNPLNEIFSETVLQTIKDFLAAVADDFRKPRAAVHIHKQRAFVQIRRLRVCSDVRVEQ
jgi:hypothetical protein